MKANRKRLDRLAGRCSQRRQYHWYQAFQYGHNGTGPDHIDPGILTMATVHASARGYDLCELSDADFLELTGIDHYEPLPVILERLTSLLTGLDIFEPDLIKKSPSWCLALVLMWYFEDMGQLPKERITPQL